MMNQNNITVRLNGIFLVTKGEKMKKSNGMRILIRWIITLIIIILLVIAYNWFFHNKVLNSYQTTRSSIELMELIEQDPDNSELSMQEIYDIFYTRYKDFNDGTFYNGFNQAYVSCALRSKIKSKNHQTCNLHEDGMERLHINATACEKAKSPFCIGKNLSDNTNFSKLEKIKSFQETVKISKNCIAEGFNDFYKTLTKDEINNIDKEVLEICNKK